MNSTQIWLTGDCLRVNGLDGSFIEQVSTPESQRFFKDLSLQTARNQMVSFQIAVCPASGSLSSFQIDFSNLQSESGELPAGNFQAYAEWFHRLHNRLVPDLLVPLDRLEKGLTIPFDPERLPDQKAGALWIDLWIPPEQPAGIYQGTLRVTADGEERCFSIRCEVGNFTVPYQNRITADFNNYADSISPAFVSLGDRPERYRDGSYQAVESSFYRMSREHRGLYHNLPYRHSGTIPESFAPELEGEGKTIRVRSWEAFDRHFGPYLDGSAFRDCRMGDYPLEFCYLPFHLGWPACYEKWGKKGYRTEYRRILKEFARHFEEKGWTSTVFEILLNHKKDYRFFPYTVDEIWYEHDQDVVDTYYDIIQGCFEDSAANIVFRMDSSNHFGNHFDHRFSDYCKMWVAGDAMFSWFPESVDVMRQKGNILWIYGSVLQSLDESLLSLYVWPIRCMMTGATGFTVWNTTGFGADPLGCPVAEGGEALFYPGSAFGMEEALPSIRLKVLRNAMQMTELAMSAPTPALLRSLEDFLNHSLGFSGKGDWFRPKPDFIHTPPRYWDFDKAVGEAALPPVYHGKSPLLIPTMQEGIYRLLSEGEAARSGVVFRFQ